MCNNSPHSINKYLTGIKNKTILANINKIIANQLKYGTVKLNKLQKREIVKMAIKMINLNYQVILFNFLS